MAKILSIYVAVILRQVTKSPRTERNHRVSISLLKPLGFLLFGLKISAGTYCKSIFFTYLWSSPHDCQYTGNLSNYAKGLANRVGLFLAVYLAIYQYDYTHYNLFFIILS